MGSRGGSVGPGGHHHQHQQTKSNEECGIRDVWASNMVDEFRLIRQVVQKYNNVAMDTEFPGVVARPLGEFRSNAEYQYNLLKCNVGLLRLIQVGVTFMTDTGELPPDYSTWQFNFKFSLSEDMYAQDSIDLLTDSGIQFDRHSEDGIDVDDFAELLMVSGLVLSEDIKWLSFHSGYDFGYLLKVLTGENLPDHENDFFDLLRMFFPNIFDVKYLMKSCKNLKGGLQEVADDLQVIRIGPQHQAGSDSLLTGQAFFEMKKLYFEDLMDDSKYCGHLYGLGTSLHSDEVMAHEPDKGVITNGETSKLKSSTSKDDDADDEQDDVENDNDISEGGVVVRVSKSKDSQEDRDSNNDVNTETVSSTTSSGSGSLSQESATGNGDSSTAAEKPASDDTQDTES